jgi:hypothetical protein
MRRTLATVGLIAAAAAVSGAFAVPATATPQTAPREACSNEPLRMNADREYEVVQMKWQDNFKCNPYNLPNPGYNVQLRYFLPTKTHALGNPVHTVCLGTLPATGWDIVQYTNHPNCGTFTWPVGNTVVIKANHHIKK